MPPKPCYWTRELELGLVEFVKQREFIWKSSGNTNHHIQQKYKAYAEFAASLGRGFTARSVRDRWVNIRSTFKQNLRKVERSRDMAKSPSEVYIPCWPLWKPLQFLNSIKSEGSESNDTNEAEFIQPNNMAVKVEPQYESEDMELDLRQRSRRTDRPRKHKLVYTKSRSKCKRVLDDLLKAMKPVTGASNDSVHTYWFFGKHVTERLNSMRNIDAKSASRDIMMLLSEYT